MRSSRSWLLIYVLLLWIACTSAHEASQDEIKAIFEKIATSPDTALFETFNDDSWKDKWVTSQHSDYPGMLHTVELCLLGLIEKDFFLTTSDISIDFLVA